MAGVDGRDPSEDYTHLLEELRLHSAEIIAKPRLVAANKMDLPEGIAHLKKFKRRHRVEITSISAAKGEGLDCLLNFLKKKTL